QMIKAGICPSDIPEEWLEEYGIQDVAVLPLLMKRQLARMSGTRLLPIQYARCLLTPVLADIERHGMKMDPAKIRALHAEATTRVREIEVQLNELTGGVPIVAGPQLATLLYDTLGFPEVMVKKGREWVPSRTDGGRPKTDAATLEKLKAKTKDQQRFLDIYF